MSASLLAWRSAACQQLLSETPPLRQGLRFDPRRAVFTAEASAHDEGASRRRSSSRQRLTTVEDLMDVSEVKLPPTNAKGLTWIRSSKRCRRNQCDALGMPIAVRTLQRPAKGFLVSARGGAKSRGVQSSSGSGVSSVSAADGQPALYVSAIEVCPPGTSRTPPRMIHPP